jgi:hypothetical protein
MGRWMRPKSAGSVLRSFVAGCAVLWLVGCGTLSGAQHTCESSFGMLEAKRVSCTGSVETVNGSPSLSIIEIGEDLDGAYRLKATITVGRGTAKASVTDVDDEEQVEVRLKVKEGEELKNLRYEAMLVEQQ